MKYIVSYFRYTYIMIIVFLKCAIYPPPPHPPPLPPTPPYPPLPPPPPPPPTPPHPPHPTPPVFKFSNQFAPPLTSNPGWWHSNQVSLVVADTLSPKWFSIMVYIDLRISGIFQRNVILKRPTWSGHTLTTLSNGTPSWQPLGNHGRWFVGSSVRQVISIDVVDY